MLTANIGEVIVLGEGVGCRRNGGTQIRMQHLARAALSRLEVLLSSTSDVQRREKSVMTTAQVLEGQQSVNIFV